MAVLATPLWWLLLFIAPIHLLMRARDVFDAAEARMLAVMYTVSVLIILALNAEVYLVRGAESFTWSGFLYNFALQIVQPMTWPHPWQPML
jgi:hypothetical protein